MFKVEKAIRENPITTLGIPGVAIFVGLAAIYFPMAWSSGEKFGLLQKGLSTIEQDIRDLKGKLDTDIKDLRSTVISNSIPINDLSSKMNVMTESLSRAETHFKEILDIMKNDIKDLQAKFDKDPLNAFTTSGTSR